MMGRSNFPAKMEKISFYGCEFMKIKEIGHFPKLPFPDGEPEKLPIWQNALKETVGYYPEGHPDLEYSLYWQWQVCMRWIVKLKWNPTIEIPDVTHFNNLKPQSEVLLAMLNLCIELHNLGFGSEFENAAKWWRECAREFQWARRSDYYFGTENLEPKASKSRIARYIQNTKNPRNPFSETAMSCWHEVSKILIDRRAILPVIYDDLYRGSQRQIPKGLGSAFSAWASAYDRRATLSFCLDTQLNQLRQDDEGNLITDGRGGYAILKFKDSQEEK